MPTPTEQLLSRTVYATDGSTTNWDFSFASGYLDPSHVKAYTTDSLGARTDIVVTLPMLIGEFQLQITPALAAGLELTIYRDTPKDAPLVDFTDESGFSEIALDTNAKQAVMVAAEAIDTVNATDVQAAIDAAEAAATAAANAAADAGTVAAGAAAAALSASAADASEAAAAGYAASINPSLFVSKDSLATDLSVVGQAATAKATPVDADTFSYLDSAASWVLKKLTWANLKATIKTYFDTLYAGKGANTDITSLGAVASINGGALAGFRNRIINGNFGVNQRAYTSGGVVGANLYGHDRWKMAASGDTYTFSTTANVTTVTIPAGKVLQQVVEGLNLESGTYTLSWSGTAQGKIGAGSYGASGITGAITGGTNTTIEFGPGTVSKVQLEFGSTATAFESTRHYGVELALCQRYLPVLKNTSGSAQQFGVGQAISNNAVYISYQFPVEARVTPTSIAAYSSTSMYLSNSGGGAYASNAIILNNASTTHASLLVTSASAVLTPGNASIVGNYGGGVTHFFNGCEL